MAQKFINNFSTKVAQTFGIADTYLYITVGDGALLPALGVDDFLLLTVYRLSGVEESGHEVVKVTAITGDMLVVERSFEGAAASQFLTGDKISARVTAATMDRMEAKQDDLGNPASDGYVLASTAAGARSWIAPPTGGGGAGSTLYLATNFGGF